MENNGRKQEDFSYLTEDWEHFKKRRTTEIEIEKAEEKQAEENDKKSNFKRFYQMNIDETSKFTQLIVKNHIAAAILNYIFQKMDKNNALMCSYKVFQERFGISKSSVGRALQVLQDGGFIYILKSGTSNIYIANPNLVWKSYGKNAKYCEFPATIVLDYDEQEIKEINKKFKSKTYMNVSEKSIKNNNENITESVDENEECNDI